MPQSNPSLEQDFVPGAGIDFVRFRRRCVIRNLKTDSWLGVRDYGCPKQDFIGSVEAINQ